VSIGDASNNLLTEIRNNAKISRERQFSQNKLMRDNLTLDIERGKMKQRILWAGIAVLLAIIVIIFIYQRKLLRKERSVQKAKEQLRLHTIQLTENEATIRKNEEMINSLSSQLDEDNDFKQEISQLNSENETLKERNKTLQKDMEKYAASMGQNGADNDVYEKLAEQNAKLQERERFLTARVIAHTEILARLSQKPRYVEESQWHEIINAVNQLFDGYSYRLHIDYPLLTEEDIFYCCLFKLRLSTSIIGILMGISASSVTKRKQRIKEKMNQPLSAENRIEPSAEIYSWN
jgi:ABC-type multidrug transport system fused ATPase/permease subunit